MVIHEIIHAIGTLIACVFFIHFTIKKLGCKKGLNDYLPPKYIFISLALGTVFFILSEKIVLPIIKIAVGDTN